MPNLKIKRLNVNAGLLDYELRTEFKERVTGISVGGGNVIVHMTNEATDGDIATATAIINNHDESGLTIEQLRQQNIAKEIATGRETYTAPIAPDTITLQTLARRVAWLENELRDIKGL